MKTAGLLVALALLIAPAAAQESSPSPSRPGMQNGIDPSENVKALSEAANKRQDDLRAAVEKMNELRFMHARELAAAQDRRIDEIAKLRAEYAEKLGDAEAKRIDAIRSVDVNAAAEDRRRTTETAAALAAQATQLAETLRSAVATSATSTQLSTQQTTTGLSSRITALEQAGYQQAGKQTLQDPQFAELLKEVRTLTQSRVSVASAGEGRGEVIYWIIGGLLLLAAVAGPIITIVTMKSKRG